MSEKKRFYHYTSKEGYRDIKGVPMDQADVWKDIIIEMIETVSSGLGFPLNYEGRNQSSSIKASKGPNDANYGNGVYMTDLPPHHPRSFISKKTGITEDKTAYYLILDPPANQVKECAPNRYLMTEDDFNVFSGNQGHRYQGSRHVNQPIGNSERYSYLKSIMLYSELTRNIHETLTGKAELNTDLIYRSIDDFIHNL